MQPIIVNLIFSISIVFITLLFVFLASTKNRYFPPILLKMRSFCYNLNNSLSFILQNTHEGIYRLDENQRYLMVNKAYCRLIGYTENEILGKKWPLTVISEDIIKTKVAYLQTKENGEDTIEVQYINKNGKQFYKEMNLYSIKNIFGKFKGCYVFIRDTSEHKLIHELSLLADSIPNICGICEGQNGDVVYYNKMWYDYTGKTFEETKKWGWQYVIHLDDIDKCKLLWQRSLDSGTPFKNEVRIKDKNGEYHWFLIRALPVKDRNDKIVKWFSTGTEIDEFMKEKELFK